MNKAGSEKKAPLW